MQLQPPVDPPASNSHPTPIKKTTPRRKLTDCAGHFGHIKLALPVFHIGFFKHCQTLLSCICKVPYSCRACRVPCAVCRVALRPSMPSVRRTSFN